MKIVIITGTRPQLIKTALLDKRLRQEHDVKIVHTGQHYDPEMSGNFFKELDIPEPDYNLGVSSGASYQQVGRMTEEIGRLLESLYEEPDLVIITGDTNSALGGALAASKLHIPIAHVEAGVRCGDRSVPEEINRILVDHMSGLLFCPTTRCGFSLTNEGIEVGRVHRTGDVLYDTYLYYSQFTTPSYQEHPYVFATFHREANVDTIWTLAPIMEALVGLGKEIYFPVHPRTLKEMEARNMAESIRLDCPQVHLLEPTSYLDTLARIRGAELVITDSGGVQREAYFAKVPCIYVGTAGWQELYDAGASKEVSADAEDILEAARTFIPQFPEGILGDGTAVEKIAEVIRDYQC